MSKEKNARLLDPNRFKIAQQNAVMPGGPENNNPMNVTDHASPNIESDSIYGDHRQMYAQMGTGMVNPMNFGPSGVTQNTPMGQGNNRSAPYNLQQQPSPNAEESLEGMRQAQEASNRGLMANPYLGMTGSPAVIPGAMDPSIPGQGAPLMTPMVTLEGAQTNQKRGDQ